jgi:hypothetical protein
MRRQWTGCNERLGVLLRQQRLEARVVAEEGVVVGLCRDRTG